MSPRAARKSTSGASSSHQRQPRKNPPRDANNHTQQVSTETLQKVSKCKSTKLITTVKKMAKKLKQPVVNSVQSDVTTSADEMPLNSRLSAMKKKVLVKKTSASGVAVESTNPTLSTSPIFKRPLTITDNHKITQKHSRPKKVRNTEEVCKELFDKCDKQVLFKMMVEKFDAEQILKGYKEKRNSWDKKEIQEEASRVLDINLENSCTANKDSKMLSLQRVLKELSNLVESCDEFAEMVLKTYGHQLKAEKVFELLQLEDIKRAILNKFTANDMLGLFSKTDYTAVVRQILEMASVNAIVEILKSRNNLETSQELLKVSLEMLSEMTPDQINQTQSNPVVTSNLQAGLTDAIIGSISSKKFLKTSELLLNFMLQNVQEIHSKETKKSFMDFLINKFNSDERADISHKVIKSILIQNKKPVSLIDISD